MLISASDFSPSPCLLGCSFAALFSAWDWRPPGFGSGHGPGSAAKGADLSSLLSPARVSGCFSGLSVLGLTEGLIQGFVLP